MPNHIKENKLFALFLVYVIMIIATSCPQEVYQAATAYFDNIKIRFPSMMSTIFFLLSIISCFLTIDLLKTSLSKFEMFCYQYKIIKGKRWLLNFRCLELCFASIILPILLVYIQIMLSFYTILLYDLSLGFTASFIVNLITIVFFTSYFYTGYKVNYLYDNCRQKDLLNY